MMHRRGLIAMLTMALAAVLTPASALAKGFSSDRITVTVEGQGKDVILIPGLSSSPRVWKEMTAALPGYRYHKVQVHGFAGTPAGGNAKGDLTASVAAEIARYIDEQKLKQVAVLGHSLGGTIGITLAGRYPDKVSKLMVIDMMPFVGAMFGGPQATAESVRPMAEQIYATSKKETPEARDKRMTETLNGMVATESMRPLALDDARKSDADVTGRAFADLVMTDLRAELLKITATTMVMYVTPAGSPLTDAQIDFYYNAAYAPVKGVTVKRAPNAAHFIMWDNAPWFQAEVKAFLAS